MTSRPETPWNRALRRSAAGLLLLLAAAGCSTMTSSRPARLSTAAVPPYVLPDPLVAGDGTRLRDPAAWAAHRAALLETFAREVYGRTPPDLPKAASAVVHSTDPAALGGLATRKEIRLAWGDDAGAPQINVLLYVPNRRPAGAGRCPVLLGLNFYGNHTVQADAGIELPGAWVPSGSAASDGHRATEAGRGADAGKWQVDRLLRRGYAVATAYCGDLCADEPAGLARGVNGWFLRTDVDSRPADAWGAIGVWAWGLSRTLDYLETDPDVDAARVVVHGHSRLGKAALWAAAQDTRFAAAISNESGCGGAALSKRIHGETVTHINTAFPHWFAKAFRRYNGRESELPVDQHQLLALIAPRPLYVASAESDDWADPEGEFLSARAASPVYRLHSRTGIDRDEVPWVNAPVGDALRYHVRTGEHDLTAFDWDQYLDFADRWVAGASACR